MPVEITPESVAEAGRADDDMPPVLFVGSGTGSRRGARADGAVARFAAAAAALGRAVVFDRAAADPGALDDALALSGFNTSALLGARQVCVLRQVDDLPPHEVTRLKRLATSSSQWWAMSAGSTGALTAVCGFFLKVRATKEADARAPPDAALRRMSIHAAPVIARVSDVAPAVASGASLSELSEAFQRFAFRKLPRPRALEIAARLDVDIRTNKRPLMLSALIQDAVRDVEERARQMPGS